MFSRLKPALGTFISGIAGGTAKEKKKKSPKLDDLLEARDYTGAITLLEFTKNTDKPIENYELWLAYCHFHMGEYQKAFNIYTELTKKPKHDKLLNLCLACCCFYMGMYKEAEELTKKGPDCPLKNRLGLHIAFQLHAEDDMAMYHSKLSEKEVEDQLCLAGLHYLMGHYNEAMTVYKSVIIENKDYLAIDVYMAFCLYKMDSFDLAQETLKVYLKPHPLSAIGVNLKACILYRLYDGKAADGELRHFLEGITPQFYFGQELIQHNKVVFENGKDAVHVLTPLIDVLSEARLNLAIYHLRQDEPLLAYNLLRDYDPSNTMEYVLKAVTFAYMGQEEGDKNHLNVAQQYYQLVGKSETECDTILGRQCMSSCFFLVNQFDDAALYLETIKGYMYSDDTYNFNYGQTKAAMKNYKDAEELFLLIKNENIKKDYVYISWLAKCFIKNMKADKAWELYTQVETSGESYSLLHLIANESYRTKQYYFAAKAFNALEHLDQNPEYWEGKRGACIGLFHLIIAGQEPKESIRNILEILKNGSSNPQLEYIVMTLEKWTKANKVKL